MEFIQNRDELEKEYEIKKLEKQQYLDALLQVVINSGVGLEGNCFYHDNTTNLYPDLYTKQLNLFWAGHFAKTRICEIGFNAGHSVMLFLLGRDKSPLDFTIFDIGKHPYTRPALEYMVKTFPYVNFNYIEGDSLVTLPNWIHNNNQYINTYDVVHVDGGHEEKFISSDMQNADLLVKLYGIIVIDDTDSPLINKYVDFYLSTGNYREINILTTIGYPHRMIQKIK